MRLFGRLFGEPAVPPLEPPAVEAGELLDLATGLLVRHFLEIGVSAMRVGRRVEFRQCGVVCELRLRDLTRSTVEIGVRIWLDFREEPVETALSWSGGDHRESIGQLVVHLAHGVLAPILRLEGSDSTELPVTTDRLVGCPDEGDAVAWRLFSGEPMIAGAHTDPHLLDEYRAEHVEFLRALGRSLAGLATSGDGAGFHWWTAVLSRAADGAIAAAVTLDGAGAEEAGAALAAAVSLPGTGRLECHQFGVMRKSGPVPPEMAVDVELARPRRGGAGWLIG